MRGRLGGVFAAAVLCIGLAAAGIGYCVFVNRMIYQESTEHLQEVYHRVNQSLNAEADRNWSAMRMWLPYLRTGADESSMEGFVAQAGKELGFSDFYFVSRDGSCRTVDGDTAYLDLQEALPRLIADHEDVVVSTAVSGKPQSLVFAVPAEHGHYGGFAYEAIAIRFQNDAMAKTLEAAAYGGKSGSYVVRPDGQVLLCDSGGRSGEIYNVLAMLGDYSNLSEDAIGAIEADFRNGNAGCAVFEAAQVRYYLTYEPVPFQDWVLLGIVPAAVINDGMNRLQTVTLILLTAAAAGIVASLLTYVTRRSRQSLLRKDTELLYQGELFSTLSSNVDDIFMMLDAKNLRVDYLSANIEKLLGIPAQEARADIRSLDALVKNRETALIFDQMTAIQPGQEMNWDRAYVHKVTGEDRWFHGTALCRELRGRKKYILVLSDRTKERRTNQTLKEAADAARNASLAKSAFLSNMSHDIRTPMNAIIGLSTLALDNVSNTGKVRDCLNKILSSSRHLLSLINDVLDVGRVENGKIRIEEQRANLAEIFHDLKLIVSGEVHSKQLELYMDIMDVSDEKVYCDKTRLNQVLLKLLTNAVKVTPPGGAVSVRLAQLPEAPEGKGLYEIRVRDTGRGMSQEAAARVFDPPGQNSGSCQGIDLGMAIARNIIDLMGGEITVSTRMDKGTEFVIRLPLRLQTGDETEQAPPVLEGLKALIVDDDFNSCDSVSAMLGKLGMQSEWTLFGREAVLRARQSAQREDPFRVYLIDWRLSDMNGIEVTRQIRSLDDKTPIIVLSAYDWADIEEEAQAAGVTAFCPKPVFQSDLRDALLTALNRKKREREEQRQMNFADRHILLTEDNELNREIAKELLEEYGFTVDTAENGSVAVRKISASAPGSYDLVLMDIQMPVMDGYEATRRIRNLEDPELSCIPIIAMTANAFDEDRRAAARCGMNGFLSKPIDIEEVVQNLKLILG